MTTTTTYPGVYIEETASTAISISSGATAVPIFALYNKFSSATKVNSWLDYLKKKGSDFDSNYAGDLSLRIYFENGGGPCYVVNENNLAKEIPKYPDITLIVSAGLSIYSAAESLCTEGSGLFAIFDGSQTEITSSYDPSDTYTANPYTAVYYPWLTASWAAKPVPISAAMAGIYCFTDKTRGVWKAPANVAIQGGVKPQFKMTDDLQGQFNQGLAINMIRTFDNRGPIVWGARTFDDSDSWRYISVRRLFNSAERDIASAMRSMIFEPNNQPTWEKVRSAVTNYLHSLWRQGALVGTTENDAYFVAIGEGVTMTSDDIAQGKMIIKVGMAAVRPAEFIILQFTQDVAEN